MEDSLFRYLDIKMIYLNQSPLEQDNILNKSLIGVKYFARTTTQFSQAIFGSDVAASNDLVAGRFITQIQGDSEEFRQIKFAITNPDDFSKL